jgi:hypothetical protein
LIYSIDLTKMAAIQGEGGLFPYLNPSAPLFLSAPLRSGPFGSSATPLLGRKAAVSRRGGKDCGAEEKPSPG